MVNPDKILDPIDDYLTENEVKKRKSQDYGLHPRLHKDGTYWLLVEWYNELVREYNIEVYHYNEKVR